mmetsp:Transcript_33665/g.82599  ORF Transcript_33665/g.82599 Transcript_33665/m.82599 type:complete len:276 (+) Transcript_33665:3-830(+)
MTSAGDLPVALLTDANADDLLLAGFRAIRRRCGTKTDSGLTKTQKAESLAFATLVEGELGRARVYEWFAVEENFLVVRAAYATGLVFPINVFMPMARKRKALSALPKEVAFEPDHHIYDGVEECLRSLSERLGDRKPFFYGDSPSALDATVYGYLALALYAPLRKSRVRQILSEYPNLVQLVNRVKQEWFPSDHVEEPPLQEPASSSDRRPRRSAAAAANDAHAKATTNSDLPAEEVDRRQRNKLFIAITVASFLGYALFGSELEFEGLEIGEAH